jgi:predicted negative regulator of RcsB-dependent stress response
MISGFMSSEKQPPASEGVKREADVYDLLAWLEVNRKKVGVAAAVLVALGFLAATTRYLKKQKEEKASAELLALKPTLVQPTNTPPPQASAFLKVAETYGGTSAAERARILAATTFFTEGRHADAEKEFARFLLDFPNSPWAANAAYGVAASQEAGNKSNEAVASYQNVVAAHADSAVARAAKLALARLHESRQQPEQALRLYDELIAPRPGAMPGEGGSPEAELRREALLRAHPNLDPKRQAPAPPVISGPSAATPAPSTNAAATNEPSEPPPPANPAPNP